VVQNFRALKKESPCSFHTRDSSRLTSSLQRQDKNRELRMPEAGFAGLPRLVGNPVEISRLATDN